MCLFVCFGVRVFVNAVCERRVGDTNACDSIRWKCLRVVVHVRDLQEDYGNVLTGTHIFLFL